MTVIYQPILLIVQNKFDFSEIKINIMFNSNLKEGIKYLYILL